MSTSCGDGLAAPPALRPTHPRFRYSGTRANNIQCERRHLSVIVMKHLLHPNQPATERCHCNAWRVKLPFKASTHYSLVEINKLCNEEDCGLHIVCSCCRQTKHLRKAPSFTCFCSRVTTLWFHACDELLRLHEIKSAEGCAAATVAWILRVLEQLTKESARSRCPLWRRIAASERPRWNCAPLLICNVS